MKSIAAALTTAILLVLDVLANQQKHRAAFQDLLNHGRDDRRVPLALDSVTPQGLRGEIGGFKPRTFFIGKI